MLKLFKQYKYLVFCSEKMEAAHHKFQQRLLGITCKDKLRNEEIRKKDWVAKIRARH